MEAIRPELKRFLFLVSLDLDVTPAQLAMALK